MCTCTRIPPAEGILDILAAWAKPSIIFLGAFSPRKASPPPHSPLLQCLISVMGACLPLGHGAMWLGCQDLPAMGVISILELAASSQPPLSDAVVNMNVNWQNALLQRVPRYELILKELVKRTSEVSGKYSKILIRIVYLINM